MAEVNRPEGSSHKPSSLSYRERCRWDSRDRKTYAAGDSKQHSSKVTSSSAREGYTPTFKPKPDLTACPGRAKPPAEPPGPPSGTPFPFSNGMAPPSPPAYGFHMLEQRTIVLADVSVRSYFALPPDYQDFTPLPRKACIQGAELTGPRMGFDRRFPPGGPVSPEFRHLGDPYKRGQNQDNCRSPGIDGHVGTESSFKRKFGDEEERYREEGREGRNEFIKKRQQLLQYGNVGSNTNGYLTDFKAGWSSPYRRATVNMGGDDETGVAKYTGTGGVHESSQSSVSLKHNEVDQGALKKAFLHYVKMVYENMSQKKNYLAEGKQGSLQCIACVRIKDFPDMHALIMHTYNSDSANLLVDHLGLHKALCVLMGWNYSKPPDNVRSYQLLPADKAAANQEDLVLWPPMVIIHNTSTGKSKGGRMEGLSNKAMDDKLRDLGFGGGSSKSMYGKEGHLGITLVKFAGDVSGLKEAIQLAEYFEKDNRGRKAWIHVQALLSGKDDGNNPSLVEVDGRTREKKRIFYGYLGTVSDLDKVDYETRKKIRIDSRGEYMASK